MKEKEYELKSVIANYIQGHLDEKRVMGYKYDVEELILVRFDKYCQEKNLKNAEGITKYFLNDWMTKSESEETFNQIKRVSTVRQLLLYINGMGIKTYIPNNYAHPERKMPYILSDDEIQELFRVIDGHKIHESRASRGYLIRMENEYKVLFRMIFTCGLRNAEACTIAVENVCLDTGKLTILNSKGNKDRIVFMPDDMTELCKKYYSYIKDKLGITSKWFFPGRNPEKPMLNTQVDLVFRRRWAETSFAENCIDKPVVHDLRFTYVTRRINMWINEGVDTNVMLPYLARFLGHKSINATHYYYHFVTEASYIIKKHDTTGPAVIPEARKYEEE